MTHPGSAPVEGRVVAGHGRRFVVETSEGARVSALTAGRQVQPICGDRVRIEPGPDDALILEVLPRASLFCKSDDRGRAVPAAANLDQVVLTLAVEPRPEAFLTDKYLAAIASMQLSASILLNKIDLPECAAVEASAHLGYLERLGYRIFRVNTRDGSGLDALRSGLTGRSSMLVGQSGVGKSSLLNALVPEARSRITELSAATGEGKHTTTATTLHPLPGGGTLLDSPGVRDLTLSHCPPQALRGLFLEFPGHAAHCRFADCLHIREPGCAVRAAVEQKEILESRYSSYKKLVNTMRQAEERKYD